MRAVTQDEKRAPFPCEDDPDLFFSELRRHKREARQKCAACPVMAACRDTALELHCAGQTEWGVWGGMDRDERDAIAQRRTAAMTVTAA